MRNPWLFPDEGTTGNNHGDGHGGSVVGPPSLEGTHGTSHPEHPQHPGDQGYDDHLLAAVTAGLMTQDEATVELSLADTLREAPR
jgi:hypothetical protein